MAEYLEKLWVDINWNNKVAKEETTTSGMPTDTPSVNLLFRYSTTDKTVYVWQGNGDGVSGTWSKGLGGSGGMTSVAIADNFTASMNTCYLVDCSTKAITVSLPATSNLKVGDRFEILDINQASTTNNILVDFVSQSQTLYNGDNFIINYSGMYMAFIWDGNKWTPFPMGLSNINIGTNTTNNYSITYDEAITSGDLVKIKSNGNVAKVISTSAGSITTILNQVGETSIDSIVSIGQKTITLNNDTILCIYHNGGSNYLMKVGTVSNSGVSWSTSTSTGIPTSNILTDLKPYGISNAIISYWSGGNAYLMMCYVNSSNGISFGTAIQSNVLCTTQKICQINSTKVVALRLNGSLTNTLNICTYSVSGTNNLVLTYDSNQIASITDAEFISNTSGTNGSFFSQHKATEIVCTNTDAATIIYRASNSVMKAVGLTISGTTFTVGTSVQINGSLCTDVSANKLGNYKTIVAFGHESNATYNIVLTIVQSGTTITPYTAISYYSNYGVHNVSVIKYYDNTCMLTYVLSNGTSYYRIFTVNSSTNAITFINSPTSIGASVPNTLNPYIPALTDYTSASTYYGTCIYGIYDASGYQPWRVFDDSSGYLANGAAQVSAGKAWVGFQYNSAKVVNRYSMQRHPNPSECPTAWVFEASNDGTNYTILHSLSGQTITDSVINYSITNSTPYLYYRIRVTATGASYASIREINFYLDNEMQTTGLVCAGTGRIIFTYTKSNGNVADQFFITGGIPTVEYNNIFGIAQTTGLANSTGSIAIPNMISTIHSGLTSGLCYYIQTDGTLGTYPTAYLFGKALSPTKMLILQGNWYS